MRKLSLFIFLLLFTAGSAFAQKGSAFYKTPYKSRNSGSFGKGTNIISIGYGVPNESGLDYNYPGWYGRNDTRGFGPVYLKYEHGVMDEVGIGLYNATAIYANEYWVGNNEYRDDAFSTSFGLLGYYHFNKLIPVSALDVYAGVGGAFRIINREDDFNNRDDSDVDVFPALKVGARYYFTQPFGVYVEGGYDNMSTVNFGISFRF